MMHKVEAIVLRSMDYRETSKILTLYTREFGALGVIVKGVRRAKNKFGASLDPLAHINAVIYKKESRELQLLTDAELITSYSRIQQDFEKLFISLSVIELTYIVTRHSEQNLSLFDLLVEVLDTIEFATKPVILLFYYFETRLIGLLGFQPLIGQCSSCGRKTGELSEKGMERVHFEYDRGSFQCSHCLPVFDLGASFDIQAMVIWEQLSRLHVKQITDVTLKQEVQGDLDRMITRYMVQHQPEMRELRSKQIFESIRERKI
jgi:DNA repair protein RecO (recombination protein O)